MHRLVKLQFLAPLLTNCENILSTNMPSSKHTHPYQRCGRVVRPGTTVLIRWCTQIRRSSWERGKSGTWENNRGLIQWGITELKTQRYSQSQRKRSKPLTPKNVSNDFSCQLSSYKQRHTGTIRENTLSLNLSENHTNITIMLPKRKTLTSLPRRRATEWFRLSIYL